MFLMSLTPTGINDAHGANEPGVARQNLREFPIFQGSIVKEAATSNALHGWKRKVAIVRAIRKHTRAVAIGRRHPRRGHDAGDPAVGLTIVPDEPQPCLQAGS